MVRQKIINNFEIGKAYKEKNRVEFLRFLLSIREFSQIKGFVKLIKQMISDIKNSNAYAFWSHFKSHLPHKRTEAGVSWDNYEFTKTDKYKTSEQLLFSMIGYNSVYHNPEVIQEYEKVKAILLAKRDVLEKKLEKLDKEYKNDKNNPEYVQKKKELENKLSKSKLNKILKNVSLSEKFLNGETKYIEFNINGENYISVSNSFFKEYTKFKKEYKKQTNSKMQSNDVIKHENFENVLIKSDTPIFKMFLERKMKPYLENSVSNDQNENYKPVLDELDEKMLQNFIENNISNGELMNGSACKILVEKDNVLDFDDNFLYVRIPDCKISKKEWEKDGINLENQYIKIPKCYVEEIDKSICKVNIPMFETFYITDKHGKEISFEGIATNFKGSEIIKGFTIHEAKIQEKALGIDGYDYIHDGNTYKMDAKDGFVIIRNENEAKILSGPKEGEVHIPEYFNLDEKNYPVKEIMTNAFANSNVEAVKIPNTVEVIQPLAFSHCKNLKAISMGNMVKEIGNSAFLNCNNLESIRISPMTENIGINPFEGCKSLKEIDVENNPIYEFKDGVLIDQYKGKIISAALGYLTSLEGDLKISLDNFVNEVGNSALKDSKNIKEISFATDQIDFKASCFENSSIEQVVGNGKEITFLEDNAFKNSQLKEFLPNLKEMNAIGCNVFLATPKERKESEVVRLLDKLSLSKEVKKEKTIENNQDIKNNKSKKNKIRNDIDLEH